MAAVYDQVGIVCTGDKRGQMRSRVSLAAVAGAITLVVAGLLSAQRTWSGVPSERTSRDGLLVEERFSWTSGHIDIQRNTLRIRIPGRAASEVGRSTESSVLLARYFHVRAAG